MSVETGWFDLDAGLGLHAGFGREQLAGREVRTNDRVIARGIGHIGRDPKVRIVDQPRAAAEPAVVAADARRKAIVVQGVYPIVPPAQDEREAAELELILRV